MKRKLVYIFSVLFTCVMFVGLFAFIIYGSQHFQLNEKYLGEWRIVGSFNQGTFEHHLNEFITFDENHVIYCKDDQCTNETYKVSGNDVIHIFKHNYHIESKINEVMKLYEADDTYKILLRWDSYNSYDQYELEGKWDVLYKDTYIDNMKLEFKDNTLIHTIDNKTMTYQYEINENNISVNDGQLSFIFIPLEDNKIVFVDTVYGAVWGLMKND